MPQPRWLLAGALVAVVAVVVLAVSLGGRDRSGSAIASSAATDPSGPPLAAASSSAIPSDAPTETATPSPSATAGATPTATPTPRPPAASRPPRATGPPRLAWAEFLSHLNDDRATVEGLNGALQTAAEAQDQTAVRRASVDILDFVEVERGWLREHPPAECYAAAHDAANAMVAAYETAAERFIDWSDAGGGLAGLAALGVAVDAADAARATFGAFGTVLEGTTCPN